MGAVYAQLSVKERIQIERWKLAKVPVREMSRALQRSKTTIYREIKRNWFSFQGAKQERPSTHRIIEVAYGGGPSFLAK